MGEVTALRRRDIADDASTVRVAGAFVELAGKGLVHGPPKSRAGLRTVAIPEAIRREVLSHLEEFVGNDPDAWVFTGLRGNPLRRGNFNPQSGWAKAARPWDLKARTSMTCATRATRWHLELRRAPRTSWPVLGHDSPRAALIYQHASSEADQAIAAALSGLVAGAWSGSAATEAVGPEREREEGDDDGAAGALVPA
jgi:integrase